MNGRMCWMGSRGHMYEARDISTVIWLVHIENVVPIVDWCMCKYLTQFSRIRTLSSSRYVYHIIHKINKERKRSVYIDSNWTVN